MTRLALIAWAVAFLAFAVIAGGLSDRVAGLHAQVESLLEKERPMTFRWNTAGPGDTITEVVLTVPRGEGQTIEEWGQSALAQRDVMQELFPPI